MKAVFQLPPDEPVDAIPYVLTPQDKTRAALAYCFIQRHVRSLNERDNPKEPEDELPGIPYE